MRTSTRAGIVVGSIGSIALCILQFHIALAIAPGIVLGGFVAGLAVAKWLDHAHYGRQLEEGFYVGMLASGLPGFIALLSLLTAGPRDTVSLAERSHLGQLNLAPLVNLLSGFGWFMIDVLVVLAAIAAGILLSTLLVQIFAWSKSRHAAQVVQQAHFAALALQRDEQWDAIPIPSEVLQGTGSITAIAVAASAKSAQIRGSLPGAALLPPTFRSTTPPAPSSVSRPPHTSNTLLWPAPTSNPAAARGRDPAVLKTMPAMPPAASSGASAVEAAGATETVATSSRRSARRKTSQARPVSGQLNEEMRRALAAWADNTQQNTPNGAGGSGSDAQEGATASSTARTPAPSTYLNSAPPAPKRNRKKNQTRDWIC